MYKYLKGNIAMYFICYKNGRMKLIETYYDPILKVYNWYFNAYLAYKYWCKDFRGLHIDKYMKIFLTIGASRYLIYLIQNYNWNNKKYVNYLDKLHKIELILKKYISNEEGLMI